MTTAFRELWKKFSSKRYREEFVTSQVKRGIPFQIRALIKHLKLSQEELASRAGLTQGVVSRAANPNYGNLTLNTIIRIAAGLDVAFIGRFVPFSELGKWFLHLREEAARVATFKEEDTAFAADAETESEELKIISARLQSATPIETGFETVRRMPRGFEGVTDWQALQQNWASRSLAKTLPHEMLGEPARLGPSAEQSQGSPPAKLDMAGAPEPPQIKPIQDIAKGSNSTGVVKHRYAQVIPINSQLRIGRHRRTHVPRPGRRVRYG